MCADNLTFINDIKNYKEQQQEIVIFISGFDKPLFCNKNNIPQELENCIETFDVDKCKNKYPESVYNKLWKEDKFIYFECLTPDMCKYKFIPVDWKIKYIDNKYAILSCEQINKNRLKKQFELRSVFDPTSSNFYSNVARTARIKNERRDSFLKLHKYVMTIDDVDISKLGTSLYESVYLLRKDVFKNFVIHCLTNDKLHMFKGIFESMYCLEMRFSCYNNCDMSILHDIDTLDTLKNILPKLESDIIPVFSDSYYIVKGSQEVPTSEPIEISFNFQKDIRNILGKVFEIIDWETTYLTGGLVTKLIKCYCERNNKLYIENSDIDLFTSNNDLAYIKLFKRLSDSNNPPDRNQVYNFNIDKLKINLIIMRDTDIISVVSQFDMTCLMAIYNDKFGLKMFFSCILSNLTKTNYTYPKAGKVKLERFDKYIKRGYSFILNKDEVAKLPEDTYKVFEMTKSS